MIARHLPATAIALAIALSAAPASSQDYPRLGVYGICTELGAPLIDSTGAFTPVVSALARYHELVMPVTPITPYRPDLAAALRAAQPGMKLIAYVPGQNIWNARNPDSTRHFPTRYRHLVDSLGAQLYNKSGQYYSLGRVNFAKRSGGRYVMAEAAADLFHDVVVQSGVWDGIFIDVLCTTISWSQTPAESVDYVRAGYSSFAAFDAAWGAAVDTLGDRLRRLSGSTFVILGNCGQGTNYESFNGWMRENFPYQNGGTWYTNMFRDPGGYLKGDLKFRAPLSNYISTLPSNGAFQPYSAENARRVRYGLGTAALGDGYGVFNETDPSTSTKQYLSWWYDEYAVDLTTGSSTTSALQTGWLGQPLGAWYQMVWVGTAPDAVTNPSFETDVTTGWQLGGSQGSTVVRDATTAAVGSASAKLHIPTVGAVPYATAFNTTGAIAMNMNALYSATFWARASSTRMLTVAAGTPGQPSLASGQIQVETYWKQFQVPLVPYTSGSGRLQFFVAEAAGDLWLDDCHLQAGSTTLYRRDFQNGIVLVNPSNTTLTAPLERDYRRIRGIVDPVTNDGATITQITVPAADARFLIGDDHIPPATILDFQAFTSPGSPPAPRSTSRPQRP